uniref:RNase H type-1 domain-containing protein n=1 Tax=Chenopodium quinoa TaxID=63459 RepID=A0A803LSN8_CHEQI
MATSEASPDASDIAMEDLAAALMDGSMDIHAMVIDSTAAQATLPNTTKLPPPTPVIPTPTMSFREVVKDDHAPIPDSSKAVSSKAVSFPKDTLTKLRSPWKLNLMGKCLGILVRPSFITQRVRAMWRPKVTRLLGFDDFQFIEPNGSRGGIWLMFNAGVELILYQSPLINYFHALFKIKPNNSEVLLTGIHASSTPLERHKLWTELHNSLPPDDTPWLVLGDLHEVVVDQPSSGTSPSPKVWSPPQRGYFKLNTDGSWVSLGVAEAGENPSYYMDHELANIINDVAALLKREWNVTILHVKRNANVLAHGLAEMGRREGDDFHFTSFLHQG